MIFTIIDTFNALSDDNNSIYIDERYAFRTNFKRSWFAERPFCTEYVLAKYAMLAGALYKPLPGGHTPDCEALTSSGTAGRNMI